MKNCLDLNLLINKSKYPNYRIKDYESESLNVVLDASIEIDNESIKSQYVIYKKKVLNLLSDSVDNFDQLHTKNRHLILETHKCLAVCNVKRQAHCQNYQKFQEHAEVRNMQVLHLFLKTPELY